MADALKLVANLHYTLLLLILSISARIRIVHIGFTLHFATINTMSTLYKSNSSSQFTLHFATINTVPIVLKEFMKLKFTLHFATINTNRADKKGII